MKDKNTFKVVIRQKKCLFGLAILACSVLIGCAGVQDTDNDTDNTIESMIHSEDFASNVDTEEDIRTDASEGVNEMETETPQTEETGEVETEQQQPEESVEEPVIEPELPDPELEGYPELSYDKAGWGLVYGEPGAQSRGNEKAKTLAAYNAYYIGNAEDKVIYLTFDCGYENGNTDAILKALAKHEVKATFFVTGFFLESQQDFVKRMVNEGHAVANHSYNHPDVAELEKEELAKELDMVKEKFEKITGTQLSMYFRPPEGKCYSKALKWTRDMGYATILWSVAHVDWNTNNQPEPEKSIQTLVKRTHPGAIVLLHNTSSTNAQILDELIETWKEMGYTIAPLSDLVGY